MRAKISILSRFLTWSARTAGHPYTFIIALMVLSIWTITGLFFGFSNTWLLIIDTIATINASLFVFIIQNTQIREMKALHIKLDGIIHALKEAESELIAIEELEEEEIDRVRKLMKEKRRKD